jgi:DNA-binding NarL/FixJ family response regulator
MSIRVALLDNDAAARNRFEAAVAAEEGIEVVASLGKGGEVVRQTCDAQPDVVVIAVLAPGSSDIDTLAQLHDVCVDGKIVALSSDSRPAAVDRALRAGANGYLLRQSALAELASAVRAVHERRRYLGRDVSAQALEQYQRERDPVPPVERLTPREFQVLQLLVEGKTRHDIALALGISPKSVDTYKSRMMLKLEIKHLPALVKFAIRHRLTSL